MSEAGHIRDEIIRAARRALIAGGTVDVGTVADELGIDRTTIFRRVGRRDHLIAEALWNTAEELSVPYSLAAHPPGTPHRAAEVMTTYVRLLSAEPWFRNFLHRDPQRALKILTTPEFPIQARMTEVVAQLLAQEPTGPLELEPEMLARLVVRVSESFIYSDLISGQDPDPESARAVFVALLG